MNKEMQNIESFYPLSPMQQGMLFHCLLEPESGAYFEQMTCSFQGEMDAPAFEQAWQRVVDRHGALRTSFVYEGIKEPVQVVHRRLRTVVENRDWQGIDPDQHPAALEDFMRLDRARGFMMSEPPLMRLALIRTGKAAYTFVWSYHHLLLDGWSVPIVLKEVMQLYQMLRHGQEVRLPPSRPYRDYILWLRKQDMSGAETFWRDYLRGFCEPTRIGTDLMPIAGETGTGPFAEEEIWLDDRTSATLKNETRRNGLTPSTLIQGALALLLSRYSGEEDVVFGVTVSGRPPRIDGIESIVGLFINTLPMRVRVQANQTFLEWLREIQRLAASMREYEYSSLMQIQGWSEIPRGTPLFEDILVYENYPVPPESDSRHEDLEAVDHHSVEWTNYPLALIAGLGERFLVRIGYDQSRYRAGTIRRMLGCIETILKSFAENPGRQLGSLPALSEQELHIALSEWNDTAVDYPVDHPVHALFELEAGRNSEATAVKFLDSHLTYGELNRRANQLAHYLRKAGVGAEMVVAICMERSFEMVVGLFGILKAGGAYLPLDPSYPSDRLSYMIEDCGIKVLLTQEKLRTKCSELNITRDPRPASRNILCLDTDWSIISKESDENPEIEPSPDNLAYVIYTSGSTGRPKGVMIRHLGVSNLNQGLINLFGIRAGSRVLQFASCGFDASVTEFFPTLGAGGVLVLAPQEKLFSAQDLMELVRAEGIGIITLPPCLLSMLPAEGTMLETVVSAGEACSWDIVSRWAAGRRLLNGYGPTEVTVSASFYWAAEDRSREIMGVPIGRANPNTQIWLLDGSLQPVPVGVLGELYVGGVGLSRGYLGRPGLTAERFIPNPFTAAPGARLYETGDLARYLPEGNIEFLGRRDQQVKIRGFRIELGEIEAALKEHPAVRQAAVLAWGDESRKIAAYVILDPNHPAPKTSEWRAFLKRKLPDYMVPSAFVATDVLPCNASGKLDRKALPRPQEEHVKSERSSVKPRDSIEAQMVSIWEEVLESQPIGVRDDFFELGGHSILAVRLISQIKAKFQIELPLAALYQNSSIEDLANLIREGETGFSSSPLVALQPKGSARPVFFSHPSGGSVHWYTDLARLMAPKADSGQPFYALQAAGLDDERKVQTRIEEMAATYVKAIRGFQSRGPYRIGGWSLGVAIAFEIAQQLWEQGERVEFLLMLDQGPILPAKEPEDNAEYLVDVFGKHLPLTVESLRRLDPGGQLGYVWKEALRLEWLHPDVTLDQFRRYVHVLKTHTEAWRRYVPRLYPGRITVFRAGTQPEDVPAASDLGWGSLAAGGIEVHDVTGDHITMLQEPHVRVLAEKLKTCLKDINPSCE